NFDEIGKGHWCDSGEGSAGFHLRTIHSGEGDTAFPAQWSRRFFACSKNLEIALAFPRLSARLKFCRSAMNNSKTRERFWRLLSAMSRHISGDPEAIRVVSLKPLAQSIPCSLE